LGDFYGSPSSGVGITGQYSNGDTINSLGGPFSTAGGSFEPISEGPSIAADASWGTDEHGCQVGVLNEGVGFGGTFPPFGEVHGGSSDTGVIGTTFQGIYNDAVNFVSSLF
jgi:hypothetical protein